MGQLVFQANSGGQTNLVGQNTASTFNLNIPLANGTLVSTGDTGTVTNTMLAGSITNAKLVNSSVTIGSTNVALGATSTTLDGVNIGATTPGTGAFTTFSASSTTTLSGGTANGVAYLNGSKVLTTGSALTFDGTNLTANNAGSQINSARYSFATPSSGYAAVFRYVGGTNNPGLYLTTAESGNLVTLASSSSNGSDQFAFGVGGSEQMRLTSTGLGIGTSSPSYKLQVVGSVGGYAASIGGSTYALKIYTDTSQVQLNDGNGEAVQFNPSSHSLNIATNSNTVATFDSSGNLGLGVTPSSWGSAYKALQLSTKTSLSQNASDLLLTANAYNNGAGWLYLTSSYATTYDQSATGQHQWFVAPSGTAGGAVTFTQAMTLDNSGNLLLGTTSFNASGNNVIISPSGVVYCDHASGTASGTAFQYFYYNNAIIGSVTQSGTSGVLYNITSDQRLKENIVDAPEFGSVIDSIQVRSYDWKADHTHQRAGFIAQELVNVAPEAVHQPADPEEMMAVDYSKLVPMLVKEIQSLRARLKAANIA